MLIPIALGGAAIANREHIWNLLGAKGLTNYEKQQAVLAKRPIFPTLESIQKGYPTQESIEYREEDQGFLRMDVRLNCNQTNMTTRKRFGATYLQEGTAIPPKFEASYQAVECGGKICQRLIDLHLRMSIVVVPDLQNSSAWQDGDEGWNEWMVEKMGRGPTSIAERIYWTYMHEMDHFQACFDYWQFLVKHIFEAVNTVYAEPGDCDRKIKEIRNNIAENFLVATARSFAFDQYPRGLPMSGGRYAKFLFAPEEQFVWRKYAEWTPERLKRITLAPKFDPISENLNKIKRTDSIDEFVKTFKAAGNTPQALKQHMTTMP